MKTHKQGYKQRRDLFPAAYFAHGCNAGAAAYSIGYAKSSSKVRGCELMKDPEIQARIKALQDALLTKHSMTADTVMKQLAAIVHFDMRKLFDQNGQMKAISDLDDDTASALASVEISLDMDGKTVLGTTRKVKMFDKNTAITNAMKHYRLLQDGIVVNAGLVQILSAEDAKAG